VPRLDRPGYSTEALVKVQSTVECQVWTSNALFFPSLPRPNAKSKEGVAEAFRKIQKS
jgi:hypothetical protein